MALKQRDTGEFFGQRSTIWPNLLEFTVLIKRLAVEN
jgi:hypothetical protein